MRRFAGWADPAGQETVYLGRMEIGVDRELPVVVGVGANATDDAHRDRADDRLARIEAEAFARRRVERALEADVGLRIIARLMVFQIGRGARDLDVALDIPKPCGVAVTWSAAASSRCPMIMWSAEKLVASTRIE